jgi:hypothetical protein
LRSRYASAVSSGSAGQCFEIAMDVFHREIPQDARRVGKGLKKRGAAGDRRPRRDCLLPLGGFFRRDLLWSSSSPYVEPRSPALPRQVYHSLLSERTPRGTVAWRMDLGHGTVPAAVLLGLCCVSISAQYWIAAPVSQHSNTHLKNRVDSEDRGRPT